MSWAVLRPQIAELIKTSSLIEDTNVATFPKLKFDGYPACYVVPATNENEYETNKENIRTYSFTINVFYETEHTGIENAMTGLEELVDALIDLFDQEDLKSGSTRTVGVNLGSSKTFINIFATPSSWGQVEGENLLMAELNVRVRVSVDVS